MKQVDDPQLSDSPITHLLDRYQTAWLKRILAFVDTTGQFAVEANQAINLQINRMKKGLGDYKRSLNELAEAFMGRYRELETSHRARQMLYDHIESGKHFEELRQKIQGKRKAFSGRNLARFGVYVPKNEGFRSLESYARDLSGYKGTLGTFPTDVESVIDVKSSNEFTKINRDKFKSELRNTILGIFPEKKQITIEDKKGINDLLDRHFQPKTNLLGDKALDFFDISDSLTDELHFLKRDYLRPLPATKGGSERGLEKAFERKVKMVRQKIAELRQIYRPVAVPDMKMDYDATVLKAIKTMNQATEKATRKTADKVTQLLKKYLSAKNFEKIDNDIYRYIHTMESSILPGNFKESRFDLKGLCLNLDRGAFPHFNRLIPDRFVTAFLGKLGTAAELHNTVESWKGLSLADGMKSYMTMLGALIDLELSVNLRSFAFHRLPASAARKALPRRVGNLLAGLARIPVKSLLEQLSLLIDSGIYVLKGSEALNDEEYLIALGHFTAATCFGGIFLLHSPLRTFLRRLLISTIGRLAVKSLSRVVGPRIATAITGVIAAGGPIIMILYLIILVFEVGETFLRKTDLEHWVALGPWGHKRHLELKFALPSFLKIEVEKKLNDQEVSLYRKIARLFYRNEQQEKAFKEALWEWRKDPNYLRQSLAELLYDINATVVKQPLLISDSMKLILNPFTPLCEVQVQGVLLNANEKIRLTIRYGDTEEPETISPFFDDYLTESNSLFTYSEQWPSQVERISFLFCFDFYRRKEWLAAGSPQEPKPNRFLTTTELQALMKQRKPFSVAKNAFRQEVIVVNATPVHLMSRQPIFLSLADFEESGNFHITISRTVPFNQFRSHKPIVIERKLHSPPIRTPESGQLLEVGPVNLLQNGKKDPHRLFHDPEEGRLKLAHFLNSADEDKPKTT